MDWMQGNGARKHDDAVGGLSSWCLVVSKNQKDGKRSSLKCVGTKSGALSWQS